MCEKKFQQNQDDKIDIVENRKAIQVKRKYEDNNGFIVWKSFSFQCLCVECSMSCHETAIGFWLSLHCLTIQVFVMEALLYFLLFFSIFFLFFTFFSIPAFMSLTTLVFIADIMKANPQKYFNIFDIIKYIIYIFEIYKIFQIMHHFFERYKQHHREDIQYSLINAHKSRFIPVMHSKS